MFPHSRLAKKAAHRLTECHRVKWVMSEDSREEVHTSTDADITLRGEETQESVLKDFAGTYSFSLPYLPGLFYNMIFQEQLTHPSIFHSRSLPESSSFSLIGPSFSLPPSLLKVKETVKVKAKPRKAS